MLAAVEGERRLFSPGPPGPPWDSDADGAGQEWCARRGWEDGELVWENKATLFLTEVVLSIRQVRPQKLPRAEAGARKRKMAAARQATRRCRLRQAQAQAEKDAGALAAAVAEELEEKEEQEDAEASEDDLVEVDRSLPISDGLGLLNTAIGATDLQRPPSRARER